MTQSWVLFHLIKSLEVLFIQVRGLLYILGYTNRSVSDREEEVCPEDVDIDDDGKMGGIVNQRYRMFLYT